MKTLIKILFLAIITGCTSYNPITNKATFKTEERGSCFKSCGQDTLCQQSCRDSCDNYGCNENKGLKGLRFGD